MSRVVTTNGILRGTVRDGVLRLLGVPFAATIDRANRFDPPQPPLPWRGERPAVEPAPAPAQSNVIGLGMRGAAKSAEDCLYLNVFAPAEPGPPRPVLVWIFGGGYLYGDGADPLFDGGNLARSQQLIVVTLNYRLGAWGFTPLHLANVGLADQLAALQWVAGNIAALGGDPDNVTVVGESAGAMSVCNLLTCPAAHGLLHRAIAQSGAADNVASRAQAEEAAATLRAHLEVEPDHADVAALLAAQAATHAELRTVHRAGPFRPCVDGALLPVQPLDAAKASASVPLIIGMNRHEHRLYVRPTLKLTDAALQAYVERRLVQCGVAAAADAARRVIALARTQALPANANAAILADVETELRFRRPMLAFAAARGSNTWVYQFDRPSTALRGWLGATHAIEIPFVFGNFDLPSTAKFVGLDADVEELSQQMMQRWGHFARQGSAPGDWPPYRTDAPLQLHFDREISCRRVDADPAVALWRDILG